MHDGCAVFGAKWPTEGPLRVLILSGDFEENLGDAAILAGTCRSLEALRPGVEISVAARDARRVPREPAVRSVPRGLAGLPALAGAARRTDLILCGGGGLFQDDDSLVKMPYWALRVAFARLLCPRVVGWSLGVGPLRARVSRWLARLCFACMESISVRDAEARALAQSLTSRPVQLVPDPALLLAPAPDARVEGWLSEQCVPLGRAAARRGRAPTLVPAARAARSVREERADALVALVGSALDRRTSSAARCAELAEHTRVALARIVGEAA